MRWEGLDVVTLSDDFAEIQQKSYFRMTWSQQQACFFAALDAVAGYSPET
jgi:hypothetical protein